MLNLQHIKLTFKYRLNLIVDLLRNIKENQKSQFEGHNWEEKNFQC